MPETQYTDYKNMLLKLSWKWARTAQEQEELLAEANLEYVKALIAFDPSRSCFSTYLYRRVVNRYHVIYNKWTPQQSELTEFIPAEKDHLDRQISFKQSLSRLTDDAKEMVQLVLDTPEDLYVAVKEEIKLNRRMISDYLRAKGWQWERIWAGYSEIAMMLKEV